MLTGNFIHSINKILLIVFFTTCIFHLSYGQNTSGSIKCYVCSSANDTECADKPAQDKFIMDCEQYFANIKQTFTPTSRDFFCRKTLEKGLTFAKDKPADQRIIRSCGNLRNPGKECIRTTDPEVKTETCDCFEPLCNSAMSPYNQIFKLIFLPLIVSTFLNISYRPLF